MAEAPWKAEDPARGQRIRAERERVGWTRTQLAEIAESSRNTIESYELGKPFKQRANAERLARAFGWDYADLMGITDEEAVKPTPKPSHPSKARSRPDSPLTRGDLDALKARLDELSTDYNSAQRDQFEQLAGRIDDVATSVGGPSDRESPTSLHEALAAQQQVLLRVLGHLDELAEEVGALRRRGSSEDGEGAASASQG